MKNKITFQTFFNNIYSRILYCIIIFSTLVSDSTAQTVTANLLISPPYSVYFRDYAGYGKTNNVLLSLFSTTNRRVYLAGSVTKDDNSIVISVKNAYRPLTPILLTANNPAMLNGLQLRKIYGDGTTNDLNLTGLTATDIGLNQALPEGSYTFCIQVKDFDTREVISTACKTIFVTYYNPPQIFNPASGLSVQGFNPQMLMVTWHNTAPQVFGITYRLKMVKLIKGITALDALNNNVQLILDKGNLITTNYLLDVSSGIKLEPGQAYAMQVIAQSPTAYFKNGGKSEVSTFFYKGPPAPSQITLLGPAENGVVQKADTLNFKWNFIDNEEKGGMVFNSKDKYEIRIMKIQTDAENKEKPDNGIYIYSNTENLKFTSSPEVAAYLKPGNNYRWNVKHITSRTLSKTQIFALKPLEISNYTVELNGKLKYNFPDNMLSAKKGYDLALTKLQVIKVALLAKMITTKDTVDVMENGVKVRRIKTTVTPQVINNLKGYPTSYQQITNPQVVTSTVTDSLGRFKVNVPINQAQFKVIDSLAYTKNETFYKVTYALVEGLMVKVDNDGFSDPGWFIVPHAGKLYVTLEEEEVQIRDYKLNVSFNEDNSRKFKGKLYLLKSKDYLVNGEADNLHGQTKDIKIVSEFLYTHIVTSTHNMVGSRAVDFNRGTEQSWVFNNLVPQTNQSDKYILYFESESGLNSLFFKLQDVNLKLPQKTAFTYNPKYKTPETSITIGPKFISMRISGRYMYNWKDPGNANTNPKLPLPEGTKLLLVKGFLSGGIENESQLEWEKKVGDATVGKNGEFNFDLGILNYEDFNLGSSSLVIVVDNPYYYSEPRRITYKENAIIKLGELLATVKQFKLDAKMAYFDKKLIGVKGLNVYLCRKKDASLPLGFPDTDGDLKHKAYFKTSVLNNGQEYEIIDKAETPENGIVSFKRLVMPVLNNQADVARNYFILAEPTNNNQFDYQTKDAYPLNSKITKAYATDVANSEKKYFSDYQIINTYNFKSAFYYVPVEPQRPSIDGSVYPYSNTSTSVLSGVKIELYHMAGIDYIEGKDPTLYGQNLKEKGRIAEGTFINGSNGRFLFNEFDYKGYNSAWKLLKLSKKGFIDTYFPVNKGKPFNNGDRSSLGKYYLNLPLEFSVAVKNDKKEKVSARVIVGDDFSWADTKLTYAKFDMASQTWVGGKQIANLTTPRGKVKLTVIPNNKTAYKTTTLYRNINGNNEDVEDLEVLSNMHTVAVTCINTATNKPIEADVYLVNKASSFEQFHQDFGAYGGKVTIINFTAAGTQFDLRVVPVDNFTIAKTQIHSDMRGDVLTTVYVSPAGTIKATAYEKKNGKREKIPFFQVSVPQYDEDEYIIRTAKATGGYLISRLPINSDVTVTGSEKGYIGKDTTVSLIDNTTYTDLEFKTLPANIPENLYGFPILISSAKPTSSNGVGGANPGPKYLISGRLDPSGDPNKSSLKPAVPGNWLSFKDIIIQPGQNGGAAQILSRIIFHENELRAILHTNYRVNIVMEEQGLKLGKDGTGGSIMGLVQLDPSSLAEGLQTSQSSKEGKKNFLYLNKEESNYAQDNISSSDYMNTFSTGTSDMLSQPLLVSTSSQRKVYFKVADNLTIMPDEKLMLTSAGMNFRGKVETSLINVNGINRNISAVADFKINNNGYTTQNEQPVNVGLNNWQLQIDKWTLNKTGFNSSGNLNAQGLTIPFTNLPITYKEIGYGNFDLTKLKLLNAFDITLNPKEVITSFGFDKGYSLDKGAWSVSILANNSEGSLASLNGLPDLGANDKILIKNINLYDTDNPADTRILLTENQPAVTLNNLAQFNPGSVSGGVDYISFKGGLDLSIPNLSGLKTESYELVYKIIDGKFQHDTAAAFKGLTFDANGVIVKFSDAGQRFSNNQLLLKGVLRDKAKPDDYAINVELTKFNLSYIDHRTIIHVPQSPDKPERVYLGGAGSSTYLDKVKGRMDLKSGVWDNFKFEGDLVAPSGIDKDSSHLSFTVKGDLVADNSKVGVQNMGAGGVSGLNLTYDFKEKALVGSCHIEKETDFANIATDLEMFIGGSKFYIFANGVAKKIHNSPITEAAMGMMVGNTTLSASQLGSLHKHFRNEVPLAFDGAVKDLKGVLFIVSIDVPIPILPTIDLDLEPIAHVEFKHGIYGNFYFKGDFPANKEGLQILIGGRLGGYVKLGIGASVGLACVSVALGADIHADLMGALKPFGSPKIKLNMGIEFTLSGEAYVGAGICNSSCQTPCIDLGIKTVCSPIPCVKKGLSKVYTIGLEAEMTESDVKILKFKY